MTRLLGLLLLTLALPAAAQEREGLQGARERWEAMTPDQRTEIRRRFEELRAMDSEHRRELEQRFEALRAAERSAVEQMPEPVRRELEALPPAERGEIVRELARDVLLERGREIRARLPAPVRERLEGARPAERLEALRELKRARRDERVNRAFDQLGRELELSEGERERFQDLPPEQREERLFELHRARVQRRVEREGVPAGVRPEEWEGWGRLSPREFHERLERRRRELGLGSSRDLFGPERARTEARGGEGERARLGELFNPDPRWHIELRGLSREQRREEIARRIRERVLEYLERSPGALAPRELERIRELEGEAFLEALRGRLGAGRLGEERRGSRGREGVK